MRKSPSYFSVLDDIVDWIEDPGHNTEQRRVAYHVSEHLSPGGKQVIAGFHSTRLEPREHGYAGQDERDEARPANVPPVERVVVHLEQEGLIFRYHCENVNLKPPGFFKIENNLKLIWYEFGLKNWNRF